MMKPHVAGLDHRGELDEIFIADASVHIERMDATAFWIGIYPPKDSGLPPLMINTGVAQGVWFFNVEQDDGLAQYYIQRPRSPVLKKTRHLTEGESE